MAVYAEILFRQIKDFYNFISHLRKKMSCMRGEIRRCKNGK